MITSKPTRPVRYASDGDRSIVYPAAGQLRGLEPMIGPVALSEVIAYLEAMSYKPLTESAALVMLDQGNPP